MQQIVDRVDKQTGEILIDVHSSSFSPSLDALRNWYRAARELDKSQNYLNRIAEVARAFKQGQPLSNRAITAIQADLRAHHQQQVTVEQIEQLSDKDLLQLHRVVTNYFKTAPPNPPTVSERQFVQSEIAQIVVQIDRLSQKQMEQVSLIESMQQNPFRILGGKYSTAVAQLQQTKESRNRLLAEKEVKEKQLTKWNQQEEAYQAWEESSKTIEMLSIAQAINLPQIQERIADISKLPQLNQQQHHPSQRLSC
ncbi:hypothetical protein ABN584_26640 [Gloeocapsa sp. BRSZ]